MSSNVISSGNERISLITCPFNPAIRLPFIVNNQYPAWIPVILINPCNQFLRRNGFLFRVCCKAEDSDTQTSHVRKIDISWFVPSFSNFSSYNIDQLRFEAIFSDFPSSHGTGNPLHEIFPPGRPRERLAPSCAFVGRYRNRNIRWLSSRETRRIKDPGLRNGKSGIYFLPLGQRSLAGRAYSFQIH